MGVAATLPELSEWTLQVLQTFLIELNKKLVQSSVSRLYYCIYCVLRHLPLKFNRNQLGTV